MIAALLLAVAIGVAPVTTIADTDADTVTDKDAATAAGAVAARATRGITGSVAVIDRGDGLRPRSDLDMDSPLLVRIAAPLADESAGARSLVLEFIGTHEGVYDLRTVLERPDGSFPEDLAPIPIEIVRRLDPGAGTDVFMEERGARPITGGYRRTLVAIGVAWILVPALVAARRIAARGADAAEAPPAPAASLAELLEPLLVAAADRSMTVEERGRLELLLSARLGERAGLAGVPRPEAIARLRRDESAGRVLLAVEGWLHRPGDPEDRRPEIARLLAPYRSVHVREGSPSAGGAA
jgi:hypothetical protein